MRSVLTDFGVDFKARNGADSLAVPVPATLLVDQKGVVKEDFVDADFTKRVEPEMAMKWVDALDFSDR